MPLNLSTGKAPRERWPLEFDLTGVPQDTRTRKTLLAQKQIEEAMPATQSVRTITENHFTVDQPTNDVFITDINNPPKKPYNPHDPKNQFPKMLYHHGNGRVLQVKDDKEEKAALKRGFKLTPSPDYDYSKVNRNSGIAAKAATRPAEETMPAEELAKLDEDDQAS